jgi:transcriptional regulator with XRE-family HTH domain
MQIKKLKNVDIDLCNRFTSIIEYHSIKGKKALDFFGIKSVSVLGEIKNHVTEPSKKMIKEISEKLGYNADWLLLGRGSKKIEADLIPKKCNDCNKLEDEIKELKVRLDESRRVASVIVNADTEPFIPVKKSPD